MKGNVIIFSYNRPRMVREAVESVLHRSVFKELTCWIIDDGSDFDILDLYEEFNDQRLIIAKGKPIPSDIRATDNSRFADNANEIMKMLKPNEFVVFMCDDDIFDPLWLQRVADYFDGDNLHLVLGDTYYFYDGENPYTDSRMGFKAGGEMRDRKDLIWWNVGNWAHRTECFLNEGLKWTPAEGKAHSWDVNYINDLQDLHKTYIFLKVPSLYRREHSNMLSVRLGRVVGDPMTEDSSYALPPNDMTADMVEGWME